MHRPIPIGMCVRLEQVASLAPGYDYLEPMVTEALNPLVDDADMAPTLKRLASFQPPVRAFNVFVPAEVRLTGEGVDWQRLEAYVDRAITRASRYDTRVIVFGSGPAREVPAGFPMARAWEQLESFLRVCADRVKGTGITIAIEPLYGGNIIRSYLEGVELAKRVGREEIKVVADIIHFARVNEPFEDILLAPEYLGHVHLSDTDRKAPPGKDEALLRRFFQLLRQVDYQGMASVEASFSGVDYSSASAQALAFLKELAS